jgi:hypothetical protein
MSDVLTLPEHTRDEPLVSDDDFLLKYLSWIENSPIMWILNSLFPPDKVKQWTYSPIALLKLAILQDKRKMGYRTVVSTLTAEECRVIGLKEIGPDQFQIPCKSTVHDFVRNRLTAEGYTALMLTLGNMACKYIRGAAGMIDSTPLPASIHDLYAQFNKHYGQKMYKFHMFHYGPFPLAAVFSDGCDYDGHFVTELVEQVLPMDPVLTKLLLDGGYDSFAVHAYLWYNFKIIPLIAFRENAVFNLEGTEIRINHAVNKLWKEGGDVHAPISKKLEFLCQHGKEEQVGGYIRNQNLLNPNFEEECKGRGDCERTHSHMKATCDFTMHGIRKESKKLYMLKRFVSYQCILITNIMRGMTNIHCSSCYI